MYTTDLIGESLAETMNSGRLRLHFVVLASGVAANRKLTGLKCLGVSETKISDAGRQKLREALPDTRIE